jgi:hypothetical protein
MDVTFGLEVSYPTYILLCTLLFRLCRWNIVTLES